MMRSYPITEEQKQVLLSLSDSYIWWQSPEEAVQYPERVVAQIMNLGTLEDTVVLLQSFSKEYLKHILDTAQAGWFLPKSWHFWHLRFSHPNYFVPPLPQREFHGNTST